jgi:hypothetical protein
MTQPVTPTYPADPTSLGSAGYTSTIILNDIFDLVVEMTTSLQNVAAAQAERLNFLTDWQKAYTDALAQVHTFIKNNGDSIDANNSSEAQARDDLNRLNSNLIQTMQNRQSVVSDEAKALQSNVNQSNDAVNQQSNLGTAIIQELSSLLSAIYK